MATATDYLSTYLEPIGDELTPNQAEKILSVKPKDWLIARGHELAEKADAGALTDRERAEYEYYVDVDDAIGLLKGKARCLLNQSAH